MTSLKKISIIFCIFLLSLVSYFFIFSSKPVAADNCGPNSNCTNQLKVTVKVSIHKGYPQGQLISSPNLQQAPAKNVVSLQDDQSKQVLYKTSVVATQIDGQYIEYILTIPSIHLSNSQETDYVPHADGGYQSLCVSSDMSSNSGFIASPTCSAYIVPTVQQYSNPSTSISVTVPVDVGIANPSVGDNKFQPGCYSSSSNTPLASCPVGAVDNNGNPIPANPTNCYIEEVGPVPAGQPALPWEQVSCSDLTTVIPPPANPTTTNAPSTATCESTGGPLSWITCAVINGISELEKHLENVVQSLLKIPPIDLNSSDCNSGTASQNYTACIYNVWSGFRVFGNIVLVIAILIVVFAETIGGGIVDAYTVKKILPRILVTAILINLSIYIVVGLVDITNVIGNGIFGLITIPFTSHGTFHINITSATGNLFGGATLLSAIGVGGALWKLSAVGGLGDALGFLALFVGLPALLAVLGVLLTIFFRTTLIVLLLMVSPVAFALYCLPNTEQYFRKWWDLLFKTLLVYPIVMVVFAMCDVGAVVVSSFNLGGEQWLGQLLSIIAVAAPLFLIPFAFKLAGGALGSLQGALTDLRKRGAEAIKGNVNDPNSMRNRTRRRFGTRRAAAGLTWGAIGTRINPRQVTASGRRNAKARLSAHRQAGLEQLRRQEEETGIFRAAQGDSNIMHELAMYSSGSQARAASTAWYRAEPGNIDQRVANGEITAAEGQAEKADLDRKYNQRNAAIAVAERIGYNPATRRAALLNQYHVGFEMAPGEQGWKDAMAAADDISGGDQFQFRSIMDEFQAIAKGPAGRVDLAGNTDGQRTYNGNRAAGSAPLSAIGQGKPAAVVGMTDYYEGLAKRIDSNSLDARDQDYINEAKERNVDPRLVATEALGAFYVEQDSLSIYASGGVRDAAAKAKRRLSSTVAKSSNVRTIIHGMQQPSAYGPTAPGAELDALSSAPEVRARARAYETPGRIAGQQTEGP